ncbi:unnamed protein product [Arabidopsis arenosa]|uniref:Protein kinase domain-containing protein n=1 Tax=Arabidopsis arenosa TaxID=38785 RepID=A0A8S1ZY44_ARAAE|nr:unnamed protein product [Arabidopsis arenosa]
MSCFSCFSSKVLDNEGSSMPAPYKQPNSPKRTTGEVVAKNANGPSNNMGARIFSFRELATATRNFRQECLIGEGGFGRVYKGKLENPAQVVAVKQLDRNGLQGQREFLVEAQPIFRDPTRYWQLADPLLRGDYPEKSFNQAIAVAAMCLHEEPTVRPLMSDVITALSFLGASSNSSNTGPNHLLQNRSKKDQDAIQWDSSPTR